VGGSLPLQKRFNLGGAATLPGYEALSVRGDRMALANLRYRIPIEGVRRLRPFQRIFQEGAWVTLLADAGRAWDSGEGDPDWLGSAGIGFAGRGTLNEVGVYLAVPSERVDEDQGDVSLFLYLGRFF
jgi:hemolysin activation/secretion protein